MVAWAPIIAGGSAVISGLIGSKGASDAADQYDKAAKRSTKLTEKLYYQGRQDLQPYTDIGQTAIDRLLGTPDRPAPGSLPVIQTNQEYNDLVTRKMALQQQINRMEPFRGTNKDAKKQIKALESEISTIDQRLINAQNALAQPEGEAGETIPGTPGLLDQYPELEQYPDLDPYPNLPRAPRAAPYPTMPGMPTFRLTADEPARNNALVAGAQRNNALPAPAPTQANNALGSGNMTAQAGPGITADMVREDLLTRYTPEQIAAGGAQLYDPKTGNPTLATDFDNALVNNVSPDGKTVTLDPSMYAISTAEAEPSTGIKGRSRRESNLFSRWNEDPQVQRNALANRPMQERSESMHDPMLGGNPNAAIYDGMTAEEARANLFQNRPTDTGQTATVDPAIYSQDPVYSAPPPAQAGPQIDLSGEGYQESPGYQYQLDQAQKAVERMAAARGYRLSPRALQEFRREAQGLASQDYWAWMDNQFRKSDLALDAWRQGRQAQIEDWMLPHHMSVEDWNLARGTALTDWSNKRDTAVQDWSNRTQGKTADWLNRYNALMGLLGVGQSSAAGQAGAAGQLSNQLSDINMINAGAQADRYINQANALTQGISSGVNNYLMYNALNQGSGGYGGGSPSPWSYRRQPSGYTPPL